MSKRSALYANKYCGLALVMIIKMPKIQFQESLVYKTHARVESLLFTVNLRKQCFIKKVFLKIRKIFVRIPMNEFKFSES